MVPPPDVSALKAHLRPEQILTSATEFEALIAPWNGAITHRPAVVVRCETITDVQAVVTFAGSQDIPLSVRGRGHDWAGRALRDGGITVDLAALNCVRVDPVTREAVVGGGTSIGELLSATGEHGLVAVTGTVASVGVVGLASGGGYGPLSGRYGLAADNLTGADVVLADGSLVTADDDLLWALRGGGGNFGVVVSARFAVHRVPSIVAGTVMYPLTQAAQVLSRLRETEFPDELYVLAAFLSGPDGTPLLLVSATWCGDAATGLAENGPVHALARLGTPVMAEVAEQGLAGSAAAMSAGFPYGRHVDLRTRSVPEVSDEIVDVLTEHFARVPSPLSTVALHAFGGAAARVAPDATAFGLRTPHRLIEMISLWPDASRSAQNRRWTADLDDALRPFALPGGYANLLGPGAMDQIPFSFGANATRLRSIKKKYDPRGVFTAISLP